MSRRVAADRRGGQRRRAGNGRRTERAGGAAGKREAEGWPLVVDGSEDKGARSGTRNARSATSLKSRRGGKMYRDGGRRRSGQTALEKGAGQDRGWVAIMTENCALPGSVAQHRHLIQFNCDTVQ